MDFSWSEMMLVGVVALIVIGPKDLPGMFRELGRITAKMRMMGREFSRAMEQAAKESGVKEAADGLKTLTNPTGAGLDAVKSAADRFEKWDPMKATAKSATPLTPPSMPPVVAASAGTATAALAEKLAADKIASTETIAKLREQKALKMAAPALVVEAPVAEPPVVKRGGRVRKKSAAEPGDAG